MIKIQGRDKEYNLEIKKGSTVVDQEEVKVDLMDNGSGSFHALSNNVSYNMEVVNADFQNKEFTIRVNQQVYTLSASDQFDELLEQLGMDKHADNAAEDFKAPMPGLVLDILVESGMEVQKGDPLMVLEAMKMENNIKCPHDGVVKSIEMEKGQAVEKNQVLITFE